MSYVDPKEILRKVRAKNAAQMTTANGGREEPPFSSGPQSSSGDGANETGGGVCAELPNLEVEAWWRDPASIPPREFLYGKHYIRRNIGASIGGGGRLKTSFSLFEAVEMTVGRNLTSGDQTVGRPLRVLFLNAEEEQDELDRRVAAICQRYRIGEADLGGRLFVKSVRDRPLRLATLVKGVPTLNEPVLEALAKLIERRQADVFMLDPWISFHAVNESGNIDMDPVIKQGLGVIASRTNSAGDILHHPGKPKPGQAETTVEDARGASAILWAARNARVFNFMRPAEADDLGISDTDRRRYVRVANGKANMGPLGKAEWIKIEVEPLPNGDEVACASRWNPPNLFDGVTTADMELARRLAQTGAYRADPRSPEWFGYALADSLNIPVSYGADNDGKDVARLKSIIKTWLQNKILKIESRVDETRHKRKFIVAGTFASSVGATAMDDTALDDEIALQ
jgi:hypothetical protein